MPASISLSGLSYSTPDGTPLFTNLDLSFGPERIGVVGRNGVGKSTLLHLITGQLRPTAGQVRLSGSVAMMQQQAISHPDDTIADLFGLRREITLLARAEAGQASAEDLMEADWTIPARIEAALLRCGLAQPPQCRLDRLSGGQRTRAALAALIFAEPEFLLLDEPTNNLDAAGRRAVIDLVQGWTHGAIIVSHDRALLEKMDAILDLTTLGVTRYGGNYSAFRRIRDAELTTAQNDLARAEQTRAEVDRRARQAAERKARKDSAGQKAGARGDQPRIVMDAAKERAEGSAAAGSRLRQARRADADTALSAARARIEIVQPLQMDIPTTGLPPGKRVLCLDHVTGGHDPDQPVIRDLSLTLTGPERVIIAGPNGSGKTTLINLITGQLMPQRGTVRLTAPFALLDQSVGLLDPAQSLHDNFRRLNRSADTRMAHAALARFRFRAQDALRAAGWLSSGERLRAGLACALGGAPTPMLLILDEPTNHLDLDGLTALESALAAYDGAVLAVSHDEAFLDALAPDRIITLTG